MQFPEICGSFLMLPDFNYKETAVEGDGEIQPRSTRILQIRGSFVSVREAKIKS